MLTVLQVIFAVKKHKEWSKVDWQRFYDRY